MPNAQASVQDVEILPDQVVESNNISDQYDKIVLVETGYIYKHGSNNNISDFISNTHNIEKEKNTGRYKRNEEAKLDKSIQPEIIYYSWEEVSDVPYPEAQSWLMNSYLDSVMEDVYITVAKDGMYANYKKDNIEVRISSLIMWDLEFEFGTRYPSRLYDVKELVTKEGYNWTCFSYKGYDEKECSSSVIACGRIICEVNFENCSNDFILKTLEACNGEGIPFSND